jgi:hypothetical protein
MNDLYSVIAVLAGIAARIALPILVTALAVHFLRRLDARWQSEAKNVPSRAEKPACWEIMGCSPARRKDCPGYVSALPCWQARRLSNGYLREECLACKVFLKAPAASPG